MTSCSSIKQIDDSTMKFQAGDCIINPHAKEYSEMIKISRVNLLKKGSYIIEPAFDLQNYRLELPIEQQDSFIKVSCYLANN